MRMVFRYILTVACTLVFCLSFLRVMERVIFGIGDISTFLPQVFFAILFAVLTWVNYKAIRTLKMKAIQQTEE